MSYTNGLDKPSDYFNTILYTGNGGGNRSYSGVGFSPDFVWFKIRSQTASHQLYDTVRGTAKNLDTNKTAAETSNNGDGFLNSFDSDGYTMNTGADSNFYSNYNNATYASWNWKAGTSFTNDASATGIGSIDSAGSVNQDAGFSIVSFDLSGQSGNETIKHGLNTAPKVVITKRRSGGAGDWTSYFGAIGNSYLVLSSTSAGATNTSFMNNTAPTSSVFTVGDPSWWGANPFIAYCFSEKQGYSKFGSYTGSGNTDGPFVYTGFKPAFVICKITSGTDQWVLYDNKRDTFNVTEQILRPNTSGAEGTESGAKMDLLSNGFKLRGSGGGIGQTNNSGGSYIYMAFAENPFVTSTGIPGLAR